jgi:uncharacterized phage infection (PIP) family protein YhgE
MARYIDADALMEELKSLQMTITGIRCGKTYLNEIVREYQKSVLKIVHDQPTAEVVPKSEVDRLNAVMKDMDEQRAYTINMLGENLENAKSEVERLQEENETLKDNNEHLAVLLEEAKQAYANYEEKDGE